MAGELWQGQGHRPEGTCRDSLLPRARCAMNNETNVSPRACARARREPPAAASGEPWLSWKGKAETANCIQTSLKAPTHFSAPGKTISQAGLDFVCQEEGRSLRFCTSLL